jgi:hypothetical protein
LKKHFITIVALSLLITTFAACGGGGEDIPTAATGEANVITAATDPTGANDPTGGGEAPAGVSNETPGGAANDPTGSPNATETAAPNAAGTAAPATTTAEITTPEPDEEVIDIDIPELMEEIEMPLPFGDNSPEGEATRSFYFPFVPKLDGVPGALLTIVPAEELEVWISDDILPENGQFSINDSKNIYTFISDFGLSASEVKKAMEIFYENTDPKILMGADVDVIISSDEAAINKRFASDYSIVKGDKIYSPSWVYENSANSYKEAGITKAELTAKLKLYKELGLSDEALKALTAKIEAYTG